MAAPLLNIKNLTVTVNDQGKENAIVDRVDLEIPEKSIVGLVGGSGSGKSTTAYSILNLLAPALHIKSGEILFKGRNLLKCTSSFLHQVRGGDIGMVFQEPLYAFNPVFTLGHQIEEVMIYHRNLTSEQRGKRVLELLDLAGLPDPKRVAESYPHQLSGGMRQRAMIAQAIAGDPKLLIADEPTSSLDVTMQARVMELFERLRKELNLSILLISHDLGMVAHMADHVAVMSKGRLVEKGLADEVIENPQHEYTKALMLALKV